jgi:hypothetical protein
MGPEVAERYWPRETVMVDAKEVNTLGLGSAKCAVLGSAVIPRVSG